MGVTRAQWRRSARRRRGQVNGGTASTGRRSTRFALTPSSETKGMGEGDFRWGRVLSGRGRGAAGWVALELDGLGPMNSPLLIFLLANPLPHLILFKAIFIWVKQFGQFPPEYLE